MYDWLAGWIDGWISASYSDPLFCSVLFPVQFLSPPQWSTIITITITIAIAIATIIIMISTFNAPFNNPREHDAQSCRCPGHSCFGTAVLLHLVIASRPRATSFLFYFILFCLLCFLLFFLLFFFSFFFFFLVWILSPVFPLTSCGYPVTFSSRYFWTLCQNVFQDPIQAYHMVSEQGHLFSWRYG
ncbi:hypothetical protein BO94DRAFT_101929 [Aspergillus sclerotioniger CBS 115572]|uniref:Uncharacterized protein n=1 Tax=Aspergillus sclerotioniger CBS 115572 TaxID=1450535 RepID=A0A317WHI0_9EURO|nr:hypothetical protein BO94DRAFT_101929 [Aspergillus sclerotioniger CBS 115572]PWY84528.1 hypothetical protein BO94DRAFT_101929 [Aspergillus sclerotioniger CBS 115572]